jgi:hypothetical protein
LAFLVSSPAVQEKLVRTALAVLEKHSAPAPSCVIALTSPGEVPYDHLVLVRREPFPAEQLQDLVREIDTHGYEVVHLPPGMPGAAAMPSTTAPRMGPATDERPFFFHLEPGTPLGLRLLLGIGSALLVVAMAVLMRAAPRSQVERAAARSRTESGSVLQVNTPSALATGLGGAPVQRQELLVAGAYFSLLGLAFLMVEVLVLQRTILFVGFPTLNLGLVLAVFLVAAGCGSVASQRLTDAGALRVVLLVLGAALAGLMPLLGGLHAPLDKLPLAMRCTAIAGVLFPFAFLMGMPFPAAVRLLRQDLRPVVPWLWGLNGIASVVGSALIVALPERVASGVAVHGCSSSGGATRRTKERRRSPLSRPRHGLFLARWRVRTGAPRLRPSEPRLHRSRHRVAPPPPRLTSGRPAPDVLSSQEPAPLARPRATACTAVPAAEPGLQSDARGPLLAPGGRWDSTFFLLDMRGAAKR